MHLNWVLVASKMLDVASKMQSLRHGFAKRTTAKIAPLLILRFKCQTAYKA